MFACVLSQQSWDSALPSFTCVFVWTVVKIDLILSSSFYGEWNNFILDMSLCLPCFCDRSYNRHASICKPKRLSCFSRKRHHVCWLYLFYQKGIKEWMYASSYSWWCCSTKTISKVLLEIFMIRFWILALLLPVSQEMFSSSLSCLANV